jgi:hypothetical protein
MGLELRGSRAESLGFIGHEVDRSPYRSMVENRTTVYA